MATLEHDVCDVHGASKFIHCFPYWGDGGVPPPTNQKFSHSPPPHQICVPSHQKSSQPNKKIKTSFLAVASHCSCAIFVFISYSFETQIMLVLILIDAQYSQNAVLALKNFQINKITPRQILSTW